ncbi:hypothetical protein KFZ70_05835 [Tamlana fucoidanivorans]|uniref:Uncharacterized protein n=1 Tax=Allotamlana fucoidanivorans TaxID=2583814 RepID=A0A5C4SRC6_9FLAO|nr:hypothetical protein [Tamlana fucoidanivorans]TNJ46974.1 hypothetical protein FGF67_00150 [Tamlana fucoidanivorans]
MKENMIITEKQRPLWQRVIAALFFTAAIALLIYTFYNANFSDKNLINIGHNLKSVIYVMGIGIGFSFHKSIYIDLDTSKFRSTVEIGPIKLGQWKVINNYEYVSVFHQPLSDGDKIYEVNLWYNKNQHWELYEKYDYNEALVIAFELSERLNIDLLDATTPNNYKWVNKTATKNNKTLVYLD